MSRACPFVVSCLVLVGVTAPAIAQDISGQYDVALRGTNVYLDRTPPRRAIADNTSMTVTQSGDRVRIELGSFAGASAATVFEGEVGNDRFAAVWWYGGSDHETKVLWGSVSGNTLRGQLIYPRVADRAGLVPGWVEVSFTARKRRAETALREDCIGFDVGAIQLENEKGRWLLTAGRNRMKVFDDREEALVALQMIERYGMNQHCFVGRPDPSLEYWLVDGRAPSGSVSGEDCLRFDPGGLQVRRRAGTWLLVEGAHSLLTFPNRSEAEQAMNVLRHHGFNQACYVGRPDPSMTYFRH